MENLADLLGFALLVFSLLAGAGAFLQGASVLSKNNLPGVAVVVVVAAIGVALIAIPPQKEDENGGLARTTEERGKDSATEEEVQDATASERPATSPTDTPCTPTELSPAAVELVRLYEELHTFKDDTEFLDRGFSQAGPYHAWMEAVEAHQDANPGWVLFHELGFAANEVLMLGMNYIDEDPNASDLSAVEFFETKIQAGLALTRCAEPETAVQDIARASAEVRRAYVDPLVRPPAGADDIDERVLNPCIAAGIARNPELDGVTPWEIRNIYPEIYDPLVAQVRAQAAPILVEFGDDARARNILLDRFRDDCIRVAHGETEPVDWSEAEVRELLSIPQ